MWSPNHEELTPDDIIKLVLGILATLLNGLLLAAIFKERKKIFVTRISYLVANLAVADLITGLALVFVEPDKLRHDDTPQYILDYKLPIMWTSMTISFLTLFLMSAERLIVVTLPMTWTRILTPRRTVMCIFLLWCIAFVCGYLINEYKLITQLCIIIIVQISALFFVGIHVYIVCLLRHRERRFAASQTMGVDNTCDGSQPQSTTIEPAPPAGQRCPNAHNKVTAVVAILIVIMILTSFPHMICMQIFALINVFHMQFTFHSRTFHDAFLYTDAFSYLNFVVNPIVYAWRLRIYRKAVCGLVPCSKDK